MTTGPSGAILEGDEVNVATQIAQVTGTPQAEINDLFTALNIQDSLANRAETLEILANLSDEEAGAALADANLENPGLFTTGLSGLLKAVDLPGSVVRSGINQVQLGTTALGQALAGDDLPEEGIPGLRGDDLGSPSVRGFIEGLSIPGVASDNTIGGGDLLENINFNPRTNTDRGGITGVIESIGPQEVSAAGIELITDPLGTISGGGLVVDTGKGLTKARRAANAANGITTTKLRRAVKPAERTARLLDNAGIQEADRIAEIIRSGDTAGARARQSNTSTLTSDGIEQERVYEAARAAGRGDSALRNINLTADEARAFGVVGSSIVNPFTGTVLASARVGSNLDLAGRALTLSPVLRRISKGARNPTDKNYLGRFLSRGVRNRRIVQEIFDEGKDTAEFRRHYDAAIDEGLIETGITRTLDDSASRLSNLASLASADVSSTISRNGAQLLADDPANFRNLVGFVVSGFRRAGFVDGDDQQLVIAKALAAAGGQPELATDIANLYEKVQLLRPVLAVGEQVGANARQLDDEVLSMVVVDEGFAELLPKLEVALFATLRQGSTPKEARDLISALSKARGVREYGLWRSGNWQDYWESIPPVPPGSITPLSSKMDGATASFDQVFNDVPGTLQRFPVPGGTRVDQTRSAAARGAIKTLADWERTNFVSPGKLSSTAPGASDEITPFKLKDADQMRTLAATKVWHSFMSTVSTRLHNGKRINYPTLYAFGNRLDYVSELLASSIPDVPVAGNAFETAARLRDFGTRNLFFKNLRAAFPTPDESVARLTDSYVRKGLVDKKNVGLSTPAQRKNTFIAGANSIYDDLAQLLPKLMVTATDNVNVNGLLPTGRGPARIAKSEADLQGVIAALAAKVNDITSLSRFVDAKTAEPMVKNLTEMLQGFSQAQAKLSLLGQGDQFFDHMVAADFVWDMFDGISALGNGLKGKVTGANLFNSVDEIEAAIDSGRMAEAIAIATQSAADFHRTGLFDVMDDAGHATLINGIAKANTDEFAEELGRGFETLARLSRTFRQSALLRPAFHIRNGFSMIVMNTMFGARAEDMNLAARMLDVARRAREDELTNLFAGQRSKIWNELGSEERVIAQQIIDSGELARTNRVREVLELSPGGEGPRLRDRLRSAASSTNPNRESGIVAAVTGLPTNTRAGVAAVGAGRASLVQNEAYSSWIRKNDELTARVWSQFLGTKQSKVSNLVSEQVGMETIGRMTMMVNRMRNGSSLETAIADTRAIHFDYDDLSIRDQRARTVMPFWTWFSRNLAFQLNWWGGRPALFANQQQIREVEKNEYGVPYTPDWATEGFTIPFSLPGDEVGQQRRASVDLPQGDFVALLDQGLGRRRANASLPQFGRDIAADSALSVLSDFSPFLRVPAEGILGQNIETGIGNNREVPAPLANVVGFSDFMEGMGWYTRDRNTGELTTDVLIEDALESTLPPLALARRSGLVDITRLDTDFPEARRDQLNDPRSDRELLAAWASIFGVPTLRIQARSQQAEITSQQEELDKFIKKMKQMGKVIDETER